MDGVRQEVQCTRQEAKSARQDAKSARQEAESARQEARDALYMGVQCAFAVACSHYLNIDLGELGQGYSADYTDAELDEILEEVAPFTRILTDKMQENNGEGC